MLAVTCLIDGKANGVVVAAEPPVSSPILLHQAHQEGAPVLPIQRVVIHILQTHLELGVGAERGWTTNRIIRNRAV